MLTMRCADVRRDLSAYHDEELSIGEQIAIQDHLDNCPSCAVEADDLIAIRDALAVEGRRCQSMWGPGLARHHSDVLVRAAAEERVAFTTWITELLEDRRRAFATVGAALAAVLLVAAGLCQLSLGTKGHPDSLAALLQQEGRLWPSRDEAPLRLPRANAESIMPTTVINQSDADETLSAFAALVTSEGTLSEVEFLGENSAGHPSAAGRQLESDLLAAATTASFQPASKDGTPVAINVVWVVTHRTVRPTLHARVEVRSRFRIDPASLRPVVAAAKV